MKQPAEHASAARLLEVRTVEIVAARGRSVTLSSVRCPARARSAAVEECAHCGRSGGVAQDPLARGEWLCCEGAAPHEPAEDGTVRAAMRRTAVALRAGLARSTAADALRARGQASAPVVDGDGRPIGVVAEAELLRARAGAKVADVMVRVALAVPETAPLGHAAALLVAHGLELVPVVSGDGVVVGVLSALDVVAWLSVPGGPLASPGAEGARGGA